MNKVIFTGHLVKDADLRYTPGGKSVIDFRIGVIDPWAPKEKTLFISACIFGRKNPENLSKGLTKGKRVLIEGNLSIERGTKKKEITFIKVYVRSLEFLTPKGSTRPVISEAPKEEKEEDEAPF